MGRHIEKQKGMARTYPGDSENALHLELELAHNGHGLDRETQHLGKDVGWFALRGLKGGVVAAFYDTVGTGSRQYRQRKASARAGPGQPREDFMAQALARLARGRHDWSRGVEAPA